MFKKALVAFASLLFGNVSRCHLSFIWALVGTCIFAFGMDASTQGAPIGDIVVVVPVDWQPGLAKWQEFRKSQGHKIELVTPCPTAELTREAIREAAKRSGNEVNFIVLAADAPDFPVPAKGPDLQRTIPTFYVDSKVVVNFGSATTIASDFPYADWRENGTYISSVGRIPATSAKSLSDYCDRVIEYESSHSPNRSLKQIDIVAGVGGFGAVTDTVVESVTRQLISDDIPREYHLSMMYASPTSVYYPSPIRFSDTAIERFNRGGLFWIYLGHGFVNTLDMIPFEGRYLPIITQDHLPQIHVADFPPIPIFLACYLGAFDAMGGCLAEQMIMQKGGPVASIAASRVTMPYGMGVLGGEMLKAMFRDQYPSVGEILTLAKKGSIAESINETSATSESNLKEADSPSRRQILDLLASTLSPTDHDIAAERIEHNYLFNLLGDPLLTIPRPSPIEFSSPKIISKGEPISISGTCPIEGRCEIEIVYPRQRVPDEAKKMRTEILKSKQPTQDMQQQLFEAANNVTISKTVLPNIRDRFETSIPTHQLPSGQFEIHVSVYGSKNWSTKCQPIVIKP